MYRMSVLYGTPDDPAAFDEYYRTVHVPIARRMEGLTSWTLTWVDEQTGEFAPDVHLPDVHLVADLCAPDRAAMDAILSSPEGVAAAEDVANFATGGVTFLYGDEESVL